MTTVVIAFHRVASIAANPSLLHGIFQGWGLVVVMSSCWFWGIVMLVATNILGCPKLYNEQLYFFGYFCHNDTSPVISSSLLDFMYIFELSATCVMAICYVISFSLMVAYRKKISSDTAGKRRRTSEKRLLMQSFIIWFCFTLEIVIFLTVPRMLPNLIGTLITSLTVIFNASVNPLLCLIFHKANSRIFGFYN